MLKNSNYWNLTLLSGSLIGAGVILLTTLRSGEKTRKIIRDNFTPVVFQVEIILEKVRTPAYLFTERTLRRFHPRNNNPTIGNISRDNS